MLAPLLLALLIVPLVEIWVLIQVSREIGGGLTIVALIVMSILGGWLLKREGMATWRRLQESLRRGQIPTAEATDGAMILFGGALMLTPGFITDIFGLLLILPPSRALLKGAFRTLLGTWFLGRIGVAGAAGKSVYAAKVLRSRRTRTRPDTASSAPQGPRTPRSFDRPDGEGGSRGTA